MILNLVFTRFTCLSCNKPKYYWQQCFVHEYRDASIFVLHNLISNKIQDSIHAGYVQFLRMKLKQWYCHFYQNLCFIQMLQSKCQCYQLSSLPFKTSHTLLQRSTLLAPRGGGVGPWIICGLLVESFVIYFCQFDFLNIGLFKKFSGNFYPYLISMGFYIGGVNLFGNLKK